MVRKYITDKISFLNEIFLDSGCPTNFEVKG